MADTPRLEVQIGANIADIERALEAVDKSLSELQKNAGDTKGLDKLQDSFEQLDSDAKKVKQELIQTGKTTKELVQTARQSAGDIAGAFGNVEGAVGDVATAASSLLQSFSTAGLAGLAIAGLTLIVDQWDNIKFAIGETEEVLRRLNKLQDAGNETRRALVGAQRAQTELLEAQLRPQEEINASKFKELNLTNDLISGLEEQKETLTGLLREAQEGDILSFGNQTLTLRQAEQALIAVVSELRGARTEAAGLTTELSALDGVTVTANVEVKIAPTGDPTPFVERVETITRGVTADLENLGAGVAGQIQADPYTTYVRDIGENLTAAFIDLQNIAQTGLTALGTSIGLALAGGAQGIQDAGRLLLGTLGGIISQIGQTFIASGTQKLIGEQLLTVFGGGAGLIAAGTALVAIGSALGSKSSGTGGGGAAFSTGGTAGVASGGGIPQSSARTPSFSAAGPSVVIFEIAGTKLVGVLNNTLDQNQRLQNPLLRV